MSAVQESRRRLGAHETRMAALSATVVLAVGIAAGWFGLSYVGKVTTDATATARLQTLGDTLGLNSDVKFHGLIVGRVRSVNAGGGDKSANIIIYDDRLDDIPAGVRARVLPGTLFGGEYVDLVEPRDAASGGGALRDGAVIPADTSAETVRLMDMFETGQRLLSAINPAELDAAVSGIAQALDGRGAELNGFVKDAYAFLSTMARHEETIYEDLRLLASTLESTAAAEPYLVSALENSLTTARTVVEKQDDIAELVGQGISSVDAAHGFLERNEEQLIRVIGLTSPTLQRYGRHADRLRRVFAWMPFVMNNGAGGIGEQGIRLDGYFYTDSLDAYTASDCPRYPGLAGPNCRGGRTYGGSSGRVGSAAERATIAELFGVDPADEGLVSAYALVSGPVLRGQEVAR